MFFLEQPLPDGSHEAQKGFIFLAELLFKIFSHFFGIGGAFAGSGDGEHQVPPVDNGGQDKITDFRPVRDVAQGVEILGIGMYPAVERVVVRGPDHQEFTRKVAGVIRPFFQGDQTGGRHFFQRPGDLRADDGHHGPAIYQGFNLAGANPAAADHQAGAIFDIQIYRVVFHSNFFLVLISS